MLRRTPLRARTGLKPSRGKRRTAAEQRHFNRVGEMGCLVCGGPAEIHHVTSDGFGWIGRSHRRVVPLCPYHHRIGSDAVQELSHAGFRDRYGIDLLEEAERLWREGSNGDTDRS